MTSPVDDPIDDPKVCPECGKKFYPLDRAAPAARVGSIVQMVYCTMQCKRRVNNRSHYGRNRAKLIAVNSARRKARRSY